MKIFRKVLLGLSWWIALTTLSAQSTFPDNGAPDHRKGRYLFTNAHVVIRYDAAPVKGYLLIEEGKVIAGGAGTIEDKAAIEIDVRGGYIYPGFIDLYSTYGIEQTTPTGYSDKPQLSTPRQGAYAWNDALKTDFRAHEKFTPNAKAAQEYLQNGFTTVLTRRTDGYSRGSGTLVSLAQVPAHEALLRKVATHEMSFAKGTSTQTYPTSLMGAIALLRQTWYDARWYASGKAPDVNISLEKWHELEQVPVFFETSNWQNLLRAQKIAQEFGAKVILKGSGDEYRRVQEIKATGAPLILPLHFPAAFDISDAITAEQLSLTDLKHWELAPANPAILSEQGVPFAFTLHGLKDKKQWHSMLLKAVSEGLSETAALKALSFAPASFLGMESSLGHLQKGAVANLVILDKPLFDQQAVVYQTWASGKPDFYQPFPKHLREGLYELNYGSAVINLHVRKADGQAAAYIQLTDTTEIKAIAELKDKFLRLEWPSGQGFIRLSGWENENGYKGRGRDESGKWLDWALTIKESSETTAEIVVPAAITKKRGSIIYPFTAYGRTEIPVAKTVLFKNATVWTNEKEGILTETDVLIENGKILKIGKSISAPKSAEVIDATGKHLASGIIDEHSHISIGGGVNEAGASSSAEVRIGDVIRDDDVNLYRQLAGGVVACQLLHGSANAIGGQSALIKYRWGLSPERLKIDGTDGFIKFALGENVKQSNWGDNQTIRFPQTRMGVEQVYIDFFSRAQAYAKDPAGRKDLGLEALAEILHKKRFITCHSYVQSEINMLMKVAEQFNFRINTFTHILEGYKVADIMKAHGCGASTFSDWWAYKYEVAEAIPYNAALMHEVGVLTAINSDDAEMGRRLNQEAAKAVKYGGVPEEEAWKMVTLNPAKLLHLDSRTGSIKPGKDADLVLWSDHPLSIYAKPLQTYVDGVKYFDIAEDALMRDEIAAEKARIINLMLQEKHKGMPTIPMQIKIEKEYHCEDIDHYHGE
jgi:imidazolonepropionase-like amidohydrolase